MIHDKIQDDIISEFEMLGNDAEMVITYLIELGQQMPPMDEGLKTEDLLVKGCQSKVWLYAFDKDHSVYFQADSNTAITKGLVSLLVRVCSGCTPEEIVNKEMYFMEKSGLARYVGTQRSNGFASMIKQIKIYALAFKVKYENG